MSHSKRNTSLAFFTSYERSLLKSTWGSQSTRLNRDSFLPFSACRLCLLPSRTPVACAFNGDFFCRECAMNNLLAQRKEIKRLEKEEERRLAEEAEAGARDDEEARLKAVEEFEKVQMGLEVKLGGNGAKRQVVGREDGKIVVEEVESKSGESRGKKRKFELDESELLRIAKEERSRAKRALDHEKAEASKTKLPSFWVPSLTPSSNQSTTLHTIKKAPKLTPICPGSSKDQPHNYSLKTLITVYFTEEKDDKTGDLIRVCPSCKKGLSNGTKAMLTKPCGHVICKPCVDKFMMPCAAESADPHSPEHTSSSSSSPSLRCFVCDTDLTNNPTKDAPHDHKKLLRPGLVEVSGEGTGFASGGKNLVKRDGVAFQC